MDRHYSYRIGRVNARFIRDQLMVSLWFIPFVMSLGAIALVLILNWVDILIPDAVLENSRLVLSSEPSEIRSYLIGMAGTILTTAGVVFSLLTLPLSTVAAQYGSRLLRLLQGDRTTQFVLGMFVSTFVYSLTAALSISPANEIGNAPQVTTSIGFFLMLGTFASLIFLIQHISTVLQAPNIAAAAGAELLEVIRADGADRIRSKSPVISTEWQDQNPFDVKSGNGNLVDGWYEIHARRTGYIQYVDPQVLLDMAVEKDVFIRLVRKTGDHVGNGTVVARVWPPEQGGEWLDETIGHGIQVGNLRTPAQDVTYAVNQLVEMAVRAMSPAINDPYTAMTCLDYLGDGLKLFIQKDKFAPIYYDQEGKPRLYFELVSFEEILGSAFDLLRHYSRENATLLLHMLRVIDDISQGAKLPQARLSLLQQVNLIQVDSQAGVFNEYDRQAIQRVVEGLATKLAST